MMDPFGGGQTGPDLADQWGQFLDQPGNRAMLLQTGLALMQPQGIGQTAMGHIGQAIGEGAAAGGREQAFEFKEAEQDRKGAETEARIAAREASANNATSRLQLAQAGLDLKRQGMDSLIAQRQAAVTVSEARARHADAQAQLAEIRARELPDSEQAKRELSAAIAERNRANSELSLARAGVVQQDADTRSNRVDITGTDVASRVTAREKRAGVDQQNADSRRIRAEREPGVSSTSVFNRNAQEKAQFQRYLENRAKEVLGPMGDPKYRGKTTNDLLADPAFVEQNRSGFQQSRTPQPSTGGTPSGTSADPLEGKIAVNPQTGQKKVRRNGAWVDM